uniref:Uncharacterized protein n=2 Tax=Lactuca sativa TaxID=4236 RepID=A0A9R1WLR9_LACSA|nr:hypothetical protein LSAT_V11C100036490 [Lactuca sativa]
MGSENHSSDHCYDIVIPIYFNRSSWGLSVNLTNENIESLWDFCDQIFVSEVEGKYSGPLSWIGIYISIASLFCILAMVADLFNGFQRRKFWFPSKYFSLNAVSITVIAVAMKLPVDLSSPMPGWVDQAAKQGSLVFMCMMMANLMPSLASMDNKSLIANVVGFAILIITIIVNMFMEINTGVIEREGFSLAINKWTFIEPHFMDVGYIYVAFLLFLLIILISSAITLPISKQILELKYQAISKTTLYDHCPQDTFDIQKLQQHVKRYWIMAETGSPQFVIACNPLSRASCVICLTGLAIYISLLVSILKFPFRIRFQSDYKWSMVAIVITQSIGVGVGVISPMFRCFTVVSFKSFTRWNRNHLEVFKVEKYWTQQLYEWKESHITFLSNGHRSRNLIRNLKKPILSAWIGLQKVIVVTCKIIGLIPTVVLLIFMYCSYYFKSIKEMMLNPPSSTHDIDEDLSNYVLLLEDIMEFAERTLKRISNSMNRVMQKAEKEQDDNLLKFVESSIGFKGVENFDICQVQPLLSIEFPNSWSLPIVTLTCIAIALPHIGKDATNNLFKCVGEGLFYTHIVEESLNNARQYVNIQKATMTLWDEVEDKYKWLENTLEKRAYEGKTSREILEWFANKAEEIVIEVSKSTNRGEPVEYLPWKLIVANSMYRITQTIILTNQSNILEINEEWLFTLLSHMIADILVACFTNIPRVITIKCHETAIEKREASVEAAAKLLGRTTEIIKRLEMYELPNIHQDKMAFIDEWRLHLQCIP